MVIYEGVLVAYRHYLWCLPCADIDLVAGDIRTASSLCEDVDWNEKLIDNS